MSYLHGKIVWGLSATGVAIALGISAVPSAPEEYRAPSEESVNSAQWVELKETMEELRVTWNPRGKKRIIERARKWRRTFEAPLLWLLERPDHGFFEDAIVLAGELGLESTHPRIAELAQSGSVSTRAVAVVAAEKLKPWPMRKLVAFLEDESVEVQAAALEVAGTRGEPPVAAIFAALGSSHESVREAAREAVPRRVASGDLQILFSMIDDALGEELHHLLRAFDSLEISDEVERFLTAFLSGAEHGAKKTVLEALTRKGSRLQDPRTVWNEVRNYNLPLEVRAAAFRCLEKTRSYDIGQLREGTLFNEPVLIYYAARCMLDAGERDGVRLLLDMLREGESSVTDDQVQVFLAARKLLSQLSGTSAGIDAWDHWFWYGGPPRIRGLPEPPTGW